MGITDLFSTSLLFGLAIVVIILWLFFAYFSYKLSEQDHKIKGIVRAMAQEVMLLSEATYGLRTELTMINSNHLPPFPTFDDSKTVTIGFGGGGEEREKEKETDELICVSDDEDDDEDDEDDEDDDEDDGEEGDDYADTDEEDGDEGDDTTQPALHEDNGQIIFLNLIDSHEPTNNNIKTVHIQEIFEMGDVDVDADADARDKELVMEEEGEELVFDGHNDLSEHIDNIHPFTTKPDYKKMSVTKLREIVVEKNLVHDASKLKKGELLKLLGDVFKVDV
jgi:hypothetical protein